MKKFRFLTVILTIALAISLLAPLSVFAEEATVPNADGSGPNFGTKLDNVGKITFTPDSSIPSGTVFTLYKILELESYNATANKYSYKYTAEWEEFYKNNEVAKKYIQVINDPYVEWVNEKKTDVELQALATAVLAYATNNSIAPVATTTYLPVSGNEASKTLIWDELDLGYYLLDSSAGLLCNLTTTNNEVEIVGKNSVTIEKKIAKLGNATLDYVDTIDAEIGETVQFKTTIDIFAGAQNYVIHDAMTEGLTFDNTSVKITNVTTGVELTTNDYTLVISELCSATINGTKNDCDFHIEIKQSYLDSVSTALGQTSLKSQKLEIIYQAELNQNAVIHEENKDIENYNETRLGFGVDRFTAWDKVTVDTFKFDLVKYDGDTGAFLSNAIFTLYESDGKTPVHLVQIDPLNYRLATSTDKDTVKVTAFSSAAGIVTIHGLDSLKLYKLSEVAAPQGYNRLKAPIDIILVDNNNTFGGTIGVWKENNGGVAIANHGGAILPSTGGTGTVIFITVGSLIALAAFVILVARKRSSGYAI